MPSPERIDEAERLMVICNACRYCEGYCAVFPAMELRRTFTPQDFVYLSNLCFECRACYYACQYAPPHEFAVNIPKTFAELRGDTYRDYTWPRVLCDLFRRNSLAVATIPALSVAVVLLLTLFYQGPSVLFSAHLGERAFYAVIPYSVIVLPATVMMLYAVLALFAGLLGFWRDTRGKTIELIDPGAFLRAVRDAFGLVQMKGGGDGCNYPDEEFGHTRRWYHHLVFYGFLLDLASTTLAAIYNHFLHWDAPYPLLSAPVVLGTVGGAMLLIGTTGLLVLKRRSDMELADRQMLDMDIAFLLLLFLTSLTGLLLLALRKTLAMGTLLAVHLGVVAGLFLTLLYGKVAHAVYRYAALVRNAIEQRRVAGLDAAKG
ncbi:MAG: tricarballylate utilization 4Fe-4S protein TcuB [Candidatus Binatia bacterium]|jgi:citrate/tricarballylate utilization protein|nr:tricarballylate utilization 4Fe-4S protein TcuB [Candidatus Binatia bacterium]